MHDYKQAEHFLKKYKYITWQLERNTKEILALKNDYDLIPSTVTSQTYGNEKVKSSSKNTNPVLKAVIKIDEEYQKRAKELEEQRQVLLTERAEIDLIIDKADLTCGELQCIQSRYFEDKEIRVISICLCCSESTVKRIKNSALHKVNAVLES